MKKTLLSLLFLALPAAAELTSADWTSIVKSEFMGGFSGVVRVAPDLYLLVNGGRFQEYDDSKHTLLREPCVPFLNESVKFEGLCSEPGRPGRFLAVSRSSLREVKRNADGTYVPGLLSYTLPPDTCSDPEGLQAVDLNGASIVVWGNRGLNEAQGTVHWAPLDLTRGGPLAASAAIPVVCPVKDDERSAVMHLSDLRVRPNGELLILANLMNLPPAMQRTVLYSPGRLVNTNGAISYEPAAAPRVLLDFLSERKVEGMDLADGKLILVSDDEGTGSFLATPEIP